MFIKCMQNQNKKYKTKIAQIFKMSSCSLYGLCMLICGIEIHVFFLFRIIPIKSQEKMTSLVLHWNIKALLKNNPSRGSHTKKVKLGKISKQGWGKFFLI